MHLENTWTPYLPFKSVHFTQKYLRSLYEERQIHEPLASSYKNGYSFSYYIKHGQTFFQQADMSPYEIKPLLLFYGAVQLLKAALLTVDEKYPQNAEVLAHGMSSRKRKSQNYDFNQDTVLIQRRGLFSYAAQQLFQLDLAGLKFKMDDLLLRIPELKDLFHQLRSIQSFYFIIKGEDNSYEVSKDILDHLHMSASRFYDFIGEDFIPIKKRQSSNIGFKIVDSKLPSSIPFFQKDLNGHWYIPCLKKSFFNLPEILTHLILLYNLSMICRYETEWWCELFSEQASLDLPFIHAFIDLTSRKFPILMAEQFFKPESERDHR